MSPFEFVTAFFAIILGLSVTHMLSAVSELIEARGRVRFSWLQALWAFTVLLLLIHSWWGIWGLKFAPHWNYAGFLFVVAFLCAAYLMSTLVFPRVPDEGNVDLAAHFESVRPIFLSFMGACFTSAILLNHFLFHVAFTSRFVLVPAVLALTAFTGATTRNRIYHRILITLYLAGTVTVMATDLTTIE